MSIVSGNFPALKLNHSSKINKRFFSESSPVCLNSSTVWLLPMSKVPARPACMSVILGLMSSVLFLCLFMPKILSLKHLLFLFSYIACTLVSYGKIIVYLGDLDFPVWICRLSLFLFCMCMCVPVYTCVCLKVRNG